MLVEGFRPGVMARLGLDDAAVRAINPGIVYCSISGYGQRDPRAALPGHDVNYQAWAGALAPEGAPATIPPLPMADLASGLTAAFGICAAVIGRGASGEGTYLDVSMTDVMATWTGPAGDRVVGTRPGGAGAGARLRPLRHGGWRAGGPGGRQRAALLVAPLRRARPEGELARLGFDERCRRGGELQRAIGGAVATPRPRRAGHLARRRRGAGGPGPRPGGDAGRDRRSPPSPSGSRCRTRRRSRRSINTVGRAFAPRLTPAVARRCCYVAGGPPTS